MVNALCAWFGLPCYLIYNQSWKTVSDGDALVGSVGMVPALQFLTQTCASIRTYIT
jgi:hypothetical protein